MSVEQRLGRFFKSEVRSSGKKLLLEGKISLSSCSDSTIQAYVRIAPPIRVLLNTEGIESPAFTAQCGCPPAKRGQLCKHVWATLLSVESNYPDFLEAKVDVDATQPAAAEPAAEPKTSSADEPAPESAKSRARAEAEAKREAYRAATKQRAAEYRKEQYRRAKERAREFKAGRKSRAAQAAAEAAEAQAIAEAGALATMSYPPEVEAALAYFDQNGFGMSAGPNAEVLSEAKRKLSRVFHPDKGGTHDEIVELNRHCEVLGEFIETHSASIN